ncbi:vanillate monooxygenase [Pseudomonas syringae pv. syringae PD2774]|uniref:aromatic ring-hydroxylating dioxygenase subunit alpha n=1 Tax=Pseudomonas syringae TaxID=317 RepID=UPI0007362E68|nr:aromatic ring-hydroxylating dioxygenase subunit alpha [Pseudomonas syringae]KTB79603.1 vanillate monooxygenase [Pseudomonas syringae pv. syringae PD2774]
MKFLKNVWYVAAWAKELESDTLLTRTILNEPVLFYRLENGSVAAIGNRCPHRFAPLSLGTKCGNSIRCAYHGLEFDNTGACVHNPHGNGKIPATRVKTYPVVERHLAIWIWMGEPHLADEALIPDYSFLADAKLTARNTGYLHSKCNYQLLCDNIMDLSHVDFLHPTTLGGGALSGTRATVKECENHQVLINWEAKGKTAPPVFAAQLSEPQAPADVWASVLWSAPSMMRLDTGATAAGTPQQDGAVSSNLHMMTPESEQTSHYFFANTRSFREDDAAFNQYVEKLILDIFTNEDKPMVESQQLQMGNAEFWSLKPLLLAGDAGAVRARRVLDLLIKNEQETDPALLTKAL